MSASETPRATPRLVVATALALLAFAGNSLLCRVALRDTGIDAAGFTVLRLVAAVLVLAALARGRAWRSGDWRSATALFAYAAAFSFAYVSLPAATGALLLFGSVQATMLGAGLRRGERFAPRQLAGLCIALGGLAALLLPGASTPSPAGAALMVLAGVAWGVYSLRARGVTDPLAATAGNFLRTLPLAASLLLGAHASLCWDPAGAAYAISSGALTSGLGYVAWYAAVPALGALRAATLQLTVPVLTALGAIVLLQEPTTLRALLCGAAILAGVALTLKRRAG